VLSVRDNESFQRFPKSPLKVAALRKRIEDFTLDADFELAVGERAALVGRSGSGKTSLLRILAGLEAPDSGTVHLGDENITFLSPQRRGVGIIFQEQALFPALNVLDNVTFGFRMRGMQGIGRDEYETEAMLWLERVGMKKFARSAVGNLSGGERQRIAFIRALIWKPRLMLLDEPFSALDRELRTNLCNELVELHRLWPVPMLLVTHDELDVAAVATSRLHLCVAGDVHLIRRSS